MDRPFLPLGDYYQLLLRNGLLADLSPLSADLTRQVTAVTCDSRFAVPGCLFLCKGAVFKVAYLEEAVRRKAMAYVSETDYAVSIPCIRVTDIRLAMGLLADLAWGHPSGALPVVGITGTKGKTTTAYLLKSALDAWRKSQGLHPVGLLSTIVTDDGALRAPAALTTPEPLDLQRHLFNAAGHNCGYMVMEVSSQALKYGRMIGVELAAAVFLNIGEDHISPREHPTAEDYFRSKLKIFHQARCGVVNLDSDRAPEILAAAGGHCQTVLTYSLTDTRADLYARDIAPAGAGLSFTAPYGGREERFGLGMAGEFNVSNALAALCVCQLAGVPVEFARAGLASAVVPGRMETYRKDGKTVIVDYAHNGMALAALLRSVRHDYPGQPVTVVFGCTGGKGLDRRAGMGQAACEYADTIFLTEDDPGPEEVAHICAEIGAHIEVQGGAYTVIPDREEAVKTAIRSSPAPGVVVLAGKGSEDRQLRKDGPAPCVPDGLLAKKYLGLPL